jgi:MFS family permease
VLNHHLDGRRPVYVYGLPIFCIGSLGVATAQNVLQVMIWRLVQAVGSGSLSVGSAVIGDIYQLEERGTALGIFYGVRIRFENLSDKRALTIMSQFSRSVFWVLHSRLLLEVLRNPSNIAVAEFNNSFSGVAAHYFSWRHLQYALALYGFFAFMLVVSILPETSHPKSRGIDKYMEPPNALPRPWKWVWINPFRSLWLLRSPTILAIVCGAFLFHSAAYGLLVQCLAGVATLMTDYGTLAFNDGKMTHH